MIKRRCGKNALVRASLHHKIKSEPDATHVLVVGDLRQTRFFLYGLTRKEKKRVKVTTLDELSRPPIEKLDDRVVYDEAAYVDETSFRVLRTGVGT